VSDGVRRRRLVLLAADFAEQNAVSIATYVDEWARRGFVEGVYFYDLREKVCQAANHSDIVPLLTVFNREVWSDVTIMSVRVDPLEAVLPERVDQEDALRDAVLRSFPPAGGVRTLFFTLSWLGGGSFGGEVFPRWFTTNLIHDRSIFVDELLPVAPFDDESRELSLAFTAVALSGGLRGQSGVPLNAVGAVDASLNLEPPVRPVRAIARSATAGRLLQRVLKQAMSNAGNLLPGKIANLNPDNGSPFIVELLTRELTSECGFVYQPHTPPRAADRRLGIFEAFREFFRGFGQYLRRAARTQVAQTIAGYLEPIANAMQRVYGSDGEVVIRGGSRAGESSVDQVAQLMQMLQAFGSAQGFDDDDQYGLRDISIAERILPDPRTWKLFCNTLIASLDGSPVPPEFKSLRQGGSVIFTDARVVGPDPISSIFKLSQSDRETLGLSGDMAFREPDHLDPRSRDEFRVVVARAKESQLFGDNLRTNDHDEDADVGGLKIRQSQSRSQGAGRVRTPQEISDAFETWSKTGTIAQEQSVLGRIGRTLEENVDRARLDIKVAECRRLIDELAARAQSRSGRLLGVVRDVVPPFGMAVLGALFLPGPWFMWGAIGLFGYAVWFGARVFIRAIRDRRRDFRRGGETELESMFRTTVRAIREYIRLSILQRQFYAWSRIVREIIHAPYGDLGSHDDDLESGAVPHPRQFSIARVSPTDQQMLQLLDMVRMSVLDRGYLKQVLDGVEGLWRNQYIQVAPGVINTDPYSDVRESTWGHRIGQRLDGSPVLFPLHDFFTEIASGDVRERAAAKLRETIDRYLGEREVGEVFGVIADIDGDHRALQNFSPSAYLFGYLKNPSAFREDFAADLYRIDTPNAIALRAENVDADKCAMWDPERRRLADFGMSSDQEMVMTTYLVAVGKLGAPRDLAGFAETTGFGEQESSDGPDSSGPFG
jgi:hypothetical protein